jgi:hypothetical protein
MKTPSQSRRRRRPTPGWKRLLQELNRQRIPWLWMLAAMIMFAAAGLIIAAFPVPYWVWTLALGSVVIQAIALAGPVALSRFRWLPANLLALLGIVGAGALAVALAIALNYSGSANLDDIAPEKTAFEVFRMSLLALAIAAVCASLLTNVGDRLIQSSFRRVPTTFIVSATGFLGLGLGGALGVLLVGT